MYLTDRKETLQRKRTNRPKRRQSKGLSLREKKAFRRILLTVLLSGGFFLFFAPQCSLYSYYSIEKKSNRLVKENQKLLEEKAALEKEIDLLLHDNAYLEKVAREKYGMLKKNEEVYYLGPQ
ncbi:MAG: septum formation initiator family protein [Candidatus Electrothrix sp. ATG1]|nr:septum formation initiator family protein [Candidatus Electrothrix sp. ATG1]